MHEVASLARPLHDEEDTNTATAAQDPGQGEMKDMGRRDREWVEIEEDWVGDKLKAVTAYFGGLVSDA